MRVDMHGVEPGFPRYETPDRNPVLLTAFSDFREANRDARNPEDREEDSYDDDDDDYAHDEDSYDDDDDDYANDEAGYGDDDSNVHDADGYWGSGKDDEVDGRDEL
jgi:hypothetical protein